MIICFNPSYLTVSIFLGFIWAEIKQMWDGGFQDYVHDWWNLMDFVMNSLYLATISLKIVAYTKVRLVSLGGWERRGFLRRHHRRSPSFLSCAVQRQQTQEPVGDVAPDARSRGGVCHRQHFQLPAPHLALHGQLSPGAAADLSGEDAAGHPEVPFHLLSGKSSHFSTKRKSGMNVKSGPKRLHLEPAAGPAGVC